MAFTNYPWTNVHELNLDWLIRTTKEVYTHIEELEKVRNELEQTNAEIKTDMRELTAKVNELNTLYAGFVDTINDKFEELRNENIATFNSLTASINAQFDTLSGNVDRELERFSADLQTLEVELRNTLNNLPSEIQMISPYTGQMETLETIVNELANSGRSDSLTAGEYDTLTLTAQTYDGKALTAYQYDWQGKSLLS